MQVPELMLINKSMIMRGICADDVEWHTSDEDHELEASACAVGPPAVVPTWKIKVHPHLKCMHQRVAVFKKHVTFCRVSRVPEATFLLLALTRLDGVAQPFIDRQPAKSRGKGKEGKKERQTSLYKGGNLSKPWYTWSLAKNTDLALRISSTNVQEASDRNWRNSWWTTSRSSASSGSVPAVSEN